MFWRKPASLTGESKNKNLNIVDGMMPCVELKIIEELCQLHYLFVRDPMFSKQYLRQSCRHVVVVLYSNTFNNVLQ